MRIHSVRFRGIGPFLDEQSIDVDALGQNGLFLLDGPTGSGKSTVIDAIVFALFDATASDGGGERLVSDFLADPISRAGRPFVELVFGTGSGVFRVRREPRYDYTNRNGRPDEQAMTVRLERLANEHAEHGELVTTKARDAAIEIKRVIGMDKSQVLSTVFLAQGQFATFLRAGSDERSAILQSVFDTARYRRLERLLADGRRSALDEREAAKAALGQAVAVIRNAAGLPQAQDELSALVTKDPAAADALVGSAIGDLDERVRVATGAAAEADLEQRDHARSLEAARRLESLAERKRGLLADQAVLDAQQATISDLDEELRRARDAAPIRPLSTAVAARRRELGQATAAVESAQAGLEPSERLLATAALRDCADEATRESAALTGLVAVEAGLPSREEQRERLDARLSDLAGRIAAREATVRDLPAHLDVVEARRGAAAVGAASLLAAQTALEEESRALTQTATVEELRARSAAAQSRAAASRTAHEAAERLADEVRRRYHSGIAGELAAALEPGLACVVCGSLEHPAPAQRSQDGATAGDVEAADAARREAARLAGAAVQEQSDLGRELAAATAALGGRTTGQIELAVRSAQDAVEQAQAAATQVEELRRQGAALAAQLEAARDDLTVMQLEERSLQVRAAELAQRVAEDRARLVEAHGAYATVGDRIKAIDARADLLRAVAGARDDLSDARKECERAEVALQAALADSPFADDAALAAAVREPLWAEDADARIRKHREERHRVTRGLSDQELADLGPEERIDLPALETAYAAAKAKADAALKVQAEAAKQASDAAAAWAAVHEALAHVSRVEADTRAAIRLGDLASPSGAGVNRLGIPLSTYVVIRRFEQVVEAANARLAEMSDGRYRLEAGADGVGRERRRGLSLRVFDDRTDAPRGPETLSGGETFYVSLALALGLADMVQSEAGGIRLDTLFVDEGFGSLDSQTLDTVMNVLTRLGRGQRTVGLISHVEEMKQRISDKVHIRRIGVSGPSEVVIDI